MVLDRGVIMKPLTLEETRLKEEMKSRCLAKGQYVDENAKKKFDMLCHLEDFEIQYWELQEENKKLNGAIQTYDILLKANVEENKRLKNLIDIILNFSFFKEECPLNFGFENNTNEDKSQSVFYEDEWCEDNCNDNYKDSWLKYFKKLQELEQGSDNNVQ